ncbi:MAG: hypothetical protein JO015_17400 [Verrucomicrobia bacterium]|nr:hypothetical protein [Verrucomicrobiota bacterium]
MRRTAIAALAAEMIATSFPSLQNRALKVKMVKTDDYVMAVRLGKKTVRLWVSKADVKRMGRRALAGVLAHELCHAEEDLQRQTLTHALVSGPCESATGTGPSAETVTERRIDAAVIRRGYGRELLAFQKYHDRYYEPYDCADGMTLNEIEAAIRDGNESVRVGREPDGQRR